MKKILLTGSNGFLGKVILDNLRDTNNIVTLARSSAHINIDLSDTIPILPKVDIIVHALGKAHDINSNNYSFYEYYKNNVLSTLNLLNGVTKEIMPSSFIYISSVSVYGRSSGKNITEDAPLLAKDPYGVSKIQAENLLSDWAKLNNVNLLILRLPLLIGKDPVGNYKSMIDAIKNYFFINVKNFEVKKSCLLASDISKNLINFSNHAGIFNLTDGNDPTISELSYAIAFKLGKRKPLSVRLSILKFFANIGDYFGNFSPINTKKLNKLSETLTFSNKKSLECLNWNPEKVLDNINF